MTYRYIDPAHTLVADDSGWSGRADALPPGVTPAPFVAAPAPVPAAITPRQLILGLLHDGHITATEADAWTLGTIPAGLETALATLPAAAAVDARISLRTMREARRHDPLTAAVAAGHGLDDAAVDDCFRRWAAL